MKKKIAIVVGCLVVVTVVAGAFWYYQTQKPAIGLAEQPSTVLLSRDPQLTEAERQNYLKNITELEGKLQAATEDAERYKLRMQIGFEQYALGEYAKARSSYLEANKLMPTNPTAFAELYVVESAMGDYENAKRHLQKAIEINPSNAQYWRWIITLRADAFQDSPEELKKYYLDGLEKTRDHVDIVTMYAQFLEKQGDVVSAVAQWKKAIELNPDQKDVYQAEIVRIQNLLK